jgi:hypothetical protein
MDLDATVDELSLCMDFVAVCVVCELLLAAAQRTTTYLYIIIIIIMLQLWVVRAPAAAARESRYG